jgi:hypothetical protein
MYSNLYTSSISMQLEEKDLWTKFHGVTNEMILTKAGRLVFLKIKLK